VTRQAERESLEVERPDVFEGSPVFPSTPIATRADVQAMERLHLASFSPDDHLGAVARPPRLLADRRLRLRPSLAHTLPIPCIHPGRR
jgi:hypothetical protein